MAGSSIRFSRVFSVSNAAGLAALAASACSSGGSPTAPSASLPDGGTTDGATGTSTFACEPSRLSTAYTSGPNGASAAPTAASGTSPCLSQTGYGSAENTLGISKDSTLFVAPGYGAAGVGVLRSRDQAASWALLAPKLPDGSGHQRAQPFLYEDPTTERLFFATTKGVLDSRGFDLSWSGDQGATWSYENVIPESQDWIKIVAGPPVAGNPNQPQGYPNVVYMTAPAPISTPVPLVGPAPDHQAFYRSLDGGVTWQAVTSISLKPADVPGCGSDWVIFGNGVVAADGAVYFGFRRCTNLAVAISNDEGATWSIQDVPGATMRAIDPSSINGLTAIIGHENVIAAEPVAIDSSGNLYALWDGKDDLLRFSLSKDKGQTWSTPTLISAPEVKSVRYGTAVLKAPGTMAIAYYGSTDGTVFNGYLAESTNALDPQPTFLGTTVNNPSDPLFPTGFDSGYAGTLSGADLIEMVQVRYAPNGDVWAAYVKEMCKGGTPSSDCAFASSATDSSAYQAVVGKLVHATPN